MLKFHWVCTLDLLRHAPSSTKVGGKSVIAVDGVRQRYVNTTSWSLGLAYSNLLNKSWNPSSTSMALCILQSTPKEHCEYIPSQIHKGWATRRGRSGQFGLLWSTRSTPSGGCNKEDHSKARLSFGFSAGLPAMGWNSQYVPIISALSNRLICRTELHFFPDQPALRDALQRARKYCGLRFYKRMKIKYSYVLRFRDIGTLCLVLFFSFPK